MPEKRSSRISKRCRCYIAALNINPCTLKSDVPQRVQLCPYVDLWVRSALTLRSAPVTPGERDSFLLKSGCRSPSVQTLCSWMLCGAVCTSSWGRCVTRCQLRQPRRSQATGVPSAWPDWWWLSAAERRFVGLNLSSMWWIFPPDQSPMMMTGQET